ncbi:LysR family transcriptional regulator [Maliponia aquimaris]|uniref:HTH-type transcriptional regulator DmlR n=1 Tax=Maliponia aquimaris TaxID=1673631 RepID=A0A238KZG5_9RHOB|nr:LysR family transcriptional regulator [Maliponia aquimaris]SMX48159.1 HTH-type transcriptional regulator DmlR [Maliponia aquimaris]
MDIVDELRAFVATAQTGSFSAAGEQLGLSNRLTSKYVAALEARLGTRLFQRTTRQVGLTPAGQDLLARAPSVLDDLDALLAEVSETRRGLTGTLRIAAPVTFGELYLAGMLARFAADHTALTLDLRLSDRHEDLAREGIDLAFRMGEPDLLSLKARRLGTFRSVAVASPAYLARHATPDTPETLAEHSCIVDTNRRQPRRWRFLKDGVERTAEIGGRLQVNSARAAAELAAGGHGIAYPPRFAVCAALESGTLVPVLRDFEGESGPLNAVYLEGRTLPRKVRALIDFAVADLRQADIL